jgi:protein TonB
LVISAAFLAVTALAQQPDENHLPLKLRVSCGVAARLLKHEVKPEPPLDANGKPRHGQVKLHITIDKTGNVTSAVMTDGEPELADAATNAVKQWTYKPYLVNGQPVEMDTCVFLKI